MFVVEDTPAFQEVSRAKPVVLHVLGEEEDHVRDWCYTDSTDPYGLATYLPNTAKASHQTFALATELIATTQKSAKRKHGTSTTKQSARLSSLKSGE